MAVETVAATPAPSTGAAAGTVDTARESSTQTSASSTAAYVSPYDAFINKADESGTTQEGGQPGTETVADATKRTEAGTETQQQQTQEDASKVAEGQDPEAPAEFRDHPRWKEIFGKSKELETLKPAYEALTALVGTTPEDAQFVVQQAQHAQEWREQMQNDPVGFARLWGQAFPDKWDQVLTAAHSGLHNTIYAPAISKAATALREAGQEDLAAQLETLVQQTAPRATTRAESRQEDPREKALAEREQALEQRTFQTFQGGVRTELGTAMKAKLDPLMSKFAFATEELKGRVEQAVLQAVRDEIRKDKVFAEREKALWQGARGNYSDDHRAALVAAYTNRASANGTLEKAAQKVFQEFGLQVMKQEEAKRQREADAQKRVEPSGGTPSGELQGKKTMAQLLNEGAKLGHRGEALYNYANEQMLAAS